jgi:hypothetical protein
MTTNLTSIVIGVVILLYVLVRQVQKRPVRESRGPRLMLILLVIGVIDLGQYVGRHPFNGTAIAVLVGSLVVAAAFGALRAYTVRLWREGGVLFRQGNVLTMILWVVAIGAHFGLDLLIDRTGGGSGLASSALTLYIAVSLGVQQLVVLSRASRLAAATGPTM